jgi:hypothetical protein
MNAIVKADDAHKLMEDVLIRGDLAKLSSEERNSYYQAVCKSVGLNPLTKPFEYIILNGKMRLYALKDCTDQLRSVRGISVTELHESERDGVFVVKAKVCNRDGRTDVSTGAVNIAGLKGEALANALMKSETKAKRRATLSICGLGMLDETEVEDIPASAKQEASRDAAPPRQATVVTQQVAAPNPQERPPVQQTDPIVQQVGPQRIVGGTYQGWADKFIGAIQNESDIAVVYKWIDANQPQLEKLKNGSPTDAARCKSATEKHIEFLRKTAPREDAPVDAMGDDAPVETKTKLKKGAVPDIKKDYDGWVVFVLQRFAKMEVSEEIDTFFEHIIDVEWPNLQQPDKEAIQSAMREAQQRLET